VSLVAMKRADESLRDREVQQEIDTMTKRNHRNAINAWPHMVFGGVGVLEISENRNKDMHSGLAIAYGILTCLQCWQAQ